MEDLIILKSDTPVYILANVKYYEYIFRYGNEEKHHYLNEVQAEMIKRLINLQKIVNKFNQHDAKDAFAKYYVFKSEKDHAFKIQEKRKRKPKTARI